MEIEQRNLTESSQIITPRLGGIVYGSKISYFNPQEKALGEDYLTQHYDTPIGVPAIMNPNSGEILLVYYWDSDNPPRYSDGSEALPNHGIEMTTDKLRTLPIGSSNNNQQESE